MTTFVERLFLLDANRCDLDELVYLSAMAKILQTEYATLGVERPTWLDARISKLNREIKARQEDFLVKRIAESQARLEALTPAEVKREKLEQQINEMRERLTQLHN